jgi:hypothetical protein
MSTKKKYYANDCLIPPPHETISKGIMRPVNNHSNNNPYHESKDDWCVDCEDAYQFTCMKDYQNLYKHVYPNDPLDYKETFYEDYNNMLDDIDEKINTNPNITKDELIDAMVKGYAIENFLDTCIQMRLNQHKYCVRKDDQIKEPLHLISQDYLEGDIGHKKHIKQLKDLKIKGSNIIAKAKNNRKVKTLKVTVNKKHKNSRANSKRTLNSRTTRSLIRRKKNKKKSSYY